MLGSEDSNGNSATFHLHFFFCTLCQLVLNDFAHDLFLLLLLYAPLSARTLSGTSWGLVHVLCCYPCYVNR